jgi:hypothetical protein
MKSAKPHDLQTKKASKKTPKTKTTKAKPFPKKAFQKGIPPKLLRIE